MVWGRRAAAVVVGCVLALVLGTLGVPGALSASLGAPVGDRAGATAGATAGSKGVGDAYFPLDGNGGYDVRHYDLDVRYDFARGRLVGRAVLTLVPRVSLRRFNLDLLLDVSSVRVAGARARHRKDGAHELVVTPRRALVKGRRTKVVVRYSGRPGELRYQGASRWLADRHEVITMGEPHMAPWWFPSNDHPSDKATFAVSVTVPRGKEAISNGRLVKRVAHSRSVTWHWRSRDPMATYLAFFTAGDFAIQRGTRAGLPWYNAVSRRLPARQERASLRHLRRTASLVAQLEKDLGDYPFEAVGGVVTSLRPGFALETQTRPTYAALTRDSTWLMVHELAHQWFGNTVSVRRWQDIWLNEGAASFMEHRYEESIGGRPAREWLAETYASYAAQDPFWDVPIGAPGKRRLFDWAVYERGAMTMQALRNRIGEKPFWQLLRSWLAQHRNANASSAQFQDLAEQVSGLDLDAFFRAWLVTPSRPAQTAANGLDPAGPSDG